ncbi:hypothetical protein LINPERHAP1_LOCUS37574 [Linum perenne]
MRSSPTILNCGRGDKRREWWLWLLLFKISSRQLADQLASDFFAWFTQSKAKPLYIDDLENILDEGMLTLNADIDDGPSA